MPVYTLSDDEVSRLKKWVVGVGGMQTYLRRLQNCLNGNTLTVSPHDLDMTCRYIEKMGDDGGWQKQIPSKLREDALDVLTRPDGDDAA